MRGIQLCVLAVGTWEAIPETSLAQGPLQGAQDPLLAVTTVTLMSLQVMLVVGTGMGKNQREFETVQSTF